MKYYKAVEPMLHCVKPSKIFPVAKSKKMTLSPNGTSLNAVSIIPVSSILPQKLPEQRLSFDAVCHITACQEI